MNVRCGNCGTVFDSAEQVCPAAAGPRKWASRNRETPVAGPLPALQLN
jgi:hypothetical protein